MFPPEVRRLDNAGVDLLRIPIGSKNYVEAKAYLLLAKLNPVDAMLGKVDDARIQLALFRACLGYAKLNHLLRGCPPPSLAAATSSFDDRLQSFLCNLVGKASIPAAAWLQSSFPIRVGGLGLTHATS